MTGRWRLGGRQLLLAGLLLAVAAIALLRTRTVAEGACTALRRHLPELTGLEVDLGRCALDPLTQEVLLGGVALYAPGAERPVLAVESARVRLGAVHLLRPGLTLDLVRLERPRLFVDLTGAKTPGDKPGVCPLELLERLRVGTLEVRNARVDARLAADSQLELDGVELGWRTRRGANELELRASRGALKLPGRGEPLAVHQAVAQASLRLGEGTLEISRAEVGVDEALVSLSGKLEELCAPSAELEAQVYLPLATVARATGSRLPMSGHTWTRWSINGPLDAPDVRGALDGHALQIGPYAPGEVSGRLALRGRTLGFEELQSQLGGGRLRVDGTLELTRDLPLRLTFEAGGASFGHILARAGVRGSWVDFAATGGGELSGILLPRPQLSGSVALKAQDFRLTSRAFDAPAAPGKGILRFARGTVRADVRIHPDRAELSGLQVETGGSRLDGAVTLHYAPSRGLEVTGSTTLALDDFGSIAGLPWKGEGEGTIRVAGPYNRVLAEGQLALRDFELDGFALGVVQGRVEYAGTELRFPGVSGQKGHTLYHGDVALDLGRAPSVKAQLAVPPGRIEDVIDVLAPLHRVMAAFQGELVGRAEGGLWLEGPLDTFGGEVRLSLADARLRGRRLGDGELLLRFVDGDRMVLEPLVLEGPLGRTSARGAWNFDSGQLDYRFAGEGWKLGELVGPELAEQSGLSATLALSGKVSGTTGTPLMSAWMQAPNVTFAGRSLGPLLLEARLVDEDLQVFGKPFRDAHGTMGIAVGGSWPYEGSLSLALPEIRPLLPDVSIAQGVSGALSGVLHAKGMLLEPEQVKLTARVERFELSRGDFRTRNEADVQVAYEAGRWNVQPFVLRGPGTELRGEGIVSERFMDARIEGVLDARLMESFVPRLERATGRVELSAVAHGSLAKPALNGSVELTSGGGSVRGAPLQFRELEARALFDQEALRLTSLAGRLNEGRLVATGEVSWKDFVPQELGLEAELDGVAVRASQDISFQADGRLTLTGPWAMPLLGGDLAVSGLRYTRGLELEELLQSVGRARVAVVEREIPEERARLGVRVALEDVRVENDLARARFGGTVLLTGTNARPALEGIVSVAEGGEAFFRGNRFAITSGQLEFTERSAFDPFVDLRAQTQVRHSVGAEEALYLVKLQALGRAREPEVTLSSDPGLPEGDIVSLLTLGFTSRNRTDTTNTGIGLLSEAFLTVTGLDRQMQRLLPASLLLMDTDVQVSTLYNPSSGVSEPTVQLESRFLTEELKLQIAQPIVSRKGTRAQAEYRFSDSVSAQAQWMDQSSGGNSVGNPGVELKWSWEVE